MRTSRSDGFAKERIAPHRGGEVAQRPYRHLWGVSKRRQNRRFGGPAHDGRAHSGPGTADPPTAHPPLRLRPYNPQRMQTRLSPPLCLGASSP
ncbi:hypothetical protein StoSoilB20_39460 [Arthrobacter sp. StoSoilB20]|nr:hypothetical protein StoSoilB20_39460 [Arthrobacter sp. StoSoilB20]